MSASTQGIKRQRTLYDSPEEQVVVTITHSRSVTDFPLALCPNVIIEKVLSCTTLQNLANFNATCRRFKAITDAPVVQRVSCTLLGIKPQSSKEENWKRMTMCKRVIQEREDGNPGVLAKHSFCKVAWEHIRDASRPLLTNPIPYLIIAATGMQMALSSAPQLNASLRLAVSKSPPQDAILPFLFLGPFRFIFDTKNILETFPLSPVAMKIALHQLNQTACGFLAHSCGSLPPDSDLFHDSFTDALSDGNATLETVKIFYDMGARPGKRTLECVLQRCVGASIMSPAWKAYTVDLFNLFLEYKAPLTERVFEIILQKIDHSLFDLDFLKRLLIAFKDQNKMKELPSTFLDAAIQSIFFNKPTNDHRIDLLIELGCRPSADTLSICRKHSRGSTAFNELYDRLSRFPEVR